MNVKPYRLPFATREHVEDQINDLIREGTIEPSSSPWNAPILIVPKKMDGSGEIKYRLVVDFRKLNEMTISDTYPLPIIADILESLGHSKYYSKIDLKSGFYQI